MTTDYLGINGIVGCIREEANDVKDCFTRFSFVSISLATAFLSVSAGLAFRHPEFSLTAIFVVVLLMTICRIGIYKYTTHNRNLGYQLHLERMANKAADQNAGSLMTWEEALFCWRVVQPEMFRKIYITPETRPWARLTRWLKMPFLDCLDQALYRLSAETHAQSHDHWYLLKELTSSRTEPGDGDNGKSTAGANKESTSSPKEPGDGDNGESTAGANGKAPSRLEVWRRRWRTWFGSRSGGDGYYPGTYMYTMFSVLFLLEFLSLVPMAVGTCTLFLDGRWLVAPLAVLVTGFLGCLIVCQMGQIDRRRTILEYELLSIHACAVTWDVVLNARTWALNEAGGDYARFTRLLSTAAHDIASETSTAPQWPRKSKSAGAGVN